MNMEYLKLSTQIKTIIAIYEANYAHEFEIREQEKIRNFALIVGDLATVFPNLDCKKLIKPI